MQRIIFCILSLSFISLTLHSQDRFTSYEDMIGKEVVFYQTDKCFEMNGPYAYSTNGKNYKPIKDALEYDSINSIPVKVTDIVVWKKKRFLEINTTLKTYYLLLDEKVDYLSFARSITYWREQFNRHLNELAYINKDCPALNGRTLGDSGAGGFYPITWSALRIPASLGEKASYDCTVRDKKVYVTEENVQSPNKYFVTRQEYAEIAAREEAERIEKARRDSIADRTLICEALLKHKNTSAYYALKEASSLLDYNEIEDTLSVYVYYAGEESKTLKTRKYKGIILGYEIEVDKDAVEFKDTEARAYVESRGFKGVAARKETAKERDKAQIDAFTKKLNDKTAKINAKLDAAHKFYRQKKIFLMKSEYAYNDFQFGLEFDVYNCFDKDIKYVDFTVVAYNAVGDKQKDYLGNHTKSAHCIGPLAKDDEGTWRFDKLFWDEFDIIERLEVTDVRITFKDGSTINYTGKSKIEPHRLSHYADEVLKIFND